MRTDNICKALLMSTHNMFSGASNEYPQHMFSLRNKKNIPTFWLKKKVPYQEL